MFLYLNESQMFFSVQSFKHRAICCFCQYLIWMIIPEYWDFFNVFRIVLGNTFLDKKYTPFYYFSPLPFTLIFLHLA